MELHGSARWAIDFEVWKPQEEEWMHALSVLSVEEMQRIQRFRRPVGGGKQIVGRDNPDAKSSCLGRLMMRHLVHEALQIPYEEIVFRRSKENKPYLVIVGYAGFVQLFDHILYCLLRCLLLKRSQATPSSKFACFSFNVSHAGRYVVLAAEPNLAVGVDVMEAAVPHSQCDADVTAFFATMSESFTAREWRTIRCRTPPDIGHQVQQFFRLWTLKEGA
eukprot:TRINITY_DN2464_c0_g1_i3.p1 TRINITY_DN2464_c0_g1~~TRINITY_DN2464_c0_g1_i3.p1  ORF type:complete len:219 (+),score=9.76 TRINITY_DN2464_c0_g1_i3:113-769(+)